MKTIRLEHRTFEKPTRYAKVSDEDYDLLSKYNWSYQVKGNLIYPTTIINNRRVKMHSFILTNTNKTVDHINHNTLDNQRENLRYATQQQQTMNRRKNKNGVTSKYKGVYEHSINDKFIAQITFNHRGIYIGSFDTEEEAALAYNKKAKELFGEFAFLNIVTSL